MCCNSVIWLSEVCYNESIVDSVVYNKFCLADMLQSDRVCVGGLEDKGCSVNIYVHTAVGATGCSIRRTPGKRNKSLTSSTHGARSILNRFQDCNA